MSSFKKRCGEGEDEIIRLVESVLKAPIVDRRTGKVEYFSGIGIPQGSPISPILMNLYLDQVDKELDKDFLQSGGIFYARYADDLLVGLKRGQEEKRVKEVVSHALSKLKFRCSYSSIQRGLHASPLKVLGLLCSFKADGRLTFNAPFLRWKKRLNLKHLLRRLEKEHRPPTLKNLVSLLMTRIRVYLFYALLAGSTKPERQKIGRFFKNLIKDNAFQFLNQEKEKWDRNRVLQEEVVKNALLKVGIMVKEVLKKQNKDDGES